MFHPVGKYGNHSTKLSTCGILAPSARNNTLTARGGSNGKIIGWHSISCLLSSPGLLTRNTRTPHSHSCLTAQSHSRQSLWQYARLVSQQEDAMHHQSRKPQSRICISA